MTPVFVVGYCTAHRANVLMSNVLRWVSRYQVKCLHEFPSQLAGSGEAAEPGSGTVAGKGGESSSPKAAAVPLPPASPMGGRDGGLKFLVVLYKLQEGARNHCCRGSPLSTLPLFSRKTFPCSRLSCSASCHRRQLTGAISSRFSQDTRRCAALRRVVQASDGRAETVAWCAGKTEN